MTDPVYERINAGDLMRSAGLMVDGPVVWGALVRSSAAGLFVVEAAEASDKAPIDHKAVRGWLERVPSLRLDGAPTTPHALAGRLGTFWVPGQPILFVGRSTRSLGARLGALYATPLGDSKPHPGGHWLKTLLILPSMRIWWAETEAHEEYEDALLSEFAAKTGATLPFANLARPDGTAKAHGLTNELREPPPRRTNAAQQADMRASDAKIKRATIRTNARRGVPRSAGSRPVPAPTYVSQEGHEELLSELEELRTNVRPAVIARVKAARELGDLKENADYEYARKEQSFMEGRIQTLETLIKMAVVVDPLAPTETVGLGSTVLVDVEGEEETYVVVGSLEADPAKGRISNVSPVGKALFGRRAGEEVTASSPGGSVIYRIKEIR